MFHLALKALEPNWRGYEGAQRPDAFHAQARYDQASPEERRALLKAVNAIETNYGLEDREVRCLAASAHVLVNDLRPKLEEIFDELPPAKDDAFREDLEACLAKPGDRTRAVNR